MPAILPFFPLRPRRIPIEARERHQIEMRARQRPHLDARPEQELPRDLVDEPVAQGGSELVLRLHQSDEVGVRRADRPAPPVVVDVDVDVRLMAAEPAAAEV